MMSPNLKFYNLIVHLSYQNKIIEENLAVKNVWKRGDNIIFNLYFYRTKKSVVVDSALIRDIFDLNTEKYYKNAKEFLKDYFYIDKESINNDKYNQPLQDNRLLKKIGIDITILVFFAKRYADFGAIKLQSIRNYINLCEPRTTSLSVQYMDSYLKGLNPSVEDFYHALNLLETKTPEEATRLANESIKVCLADGQIHYNEKVYLADMMQILREKGLEPDVMM